ncbi:MAG: class I SAM-dependent rRNA methyltransferase [Syntrophotaleaceae bacterium]
MKKDMFQIGPQTLQMLELGHPWVIADRYTKTWPSGRPGDLVELRDAGGQMVATALLDPKDRIVARVLERGPMNFGGAWLAEKIQRALNLRTRTLDLDRTSAYRLVNAEGDGLPGLTVDRYENHLMVQFFCRSWQPHLTMIADTLDKLLKPRGIYVKHRPQQTRELADEGKRCSRLLTGRGAPGRLQVMENGLNFLVELETGLNTGLFCDQRNNRRDLMGRIRGGSVLNLFSYTGAFSVAAAAGAARVTSVDASAGYLDWARENFAANRLNPKRHEFILGDCFTVLEELVRKKDRFDLVIMDPPSFSTVGKSRFTTTGGTAELVTLALDLLPAGGLLVTSSNHQKVDWADYLKELRRGALRAGCDLRILATSGQGEDFPYSVTFPEGRYLKFVIGMKG